MKAVVSELQLLVVMGGNATAAEVDEVLARLEEAGADPRVTPGRHGTVIGAIAPSDSLALLDLESYPGVERILPIGRPHKLVARETSPDPTLIQVRGRRIGRGYFGLIAGPCTVESREQTLETARAVCAAGATMSAAVRSSRGRRPTRSRGTRRRRPADPRGGARGDRAPADHRAHRPAPSGGRIRGGRGPDRGPEHAEFHASLRGRKMDKPVMLKRSPSASVAELLMAAEYVAKEGNPRVMLCERDIRTFERSTRFTLDIAAIPVLKEETHLPVIVDPSHAAAGGRSSRRSPPPRSPQEQTESSGDSPAPARPSATRSNRFRPTSSPPC